MSRATTAGRSDVGKIVLGIVVVLLTNVALAAYVFLLLKASIDWAYIAGVAVGVLFGSLFVRPAVAVNNLLRRSNSVTEPGYVTSFLCVLSGVLYADPIANSIPRIWPPSQPPQPLYHPVAVSALVVCVYLTVFSVALAETTKQSITGTWSVGVIQALIQCAIGVGCLYVLLLLT